MSDFLLIQSTHRRHEESFEAWRGAILEADILIKILSIFVDGPAGANYAEFFRVFGRLRH